MGAIKQQSRPPNLHILSFGMPAIDNYIYYSVMPQTGWVHYIS